MYVFGDWIEGIIGNLSFWWLSVIFGPWLAKSVGYFWSSTIIFGPWLARLFLVRDWKSRFAWQEGHVTDPWLKFCSLSCVTMKTVFCPKTGTVRQVWDTSGTCPGHVQDMSMTSATKLLQIIVSNFQHCGFNW